VVDEGCRGRWMVKFVCGRLPFLVGFASRKLGQRRWDSI